MRKILKILIELRTLKKFYVKDTDEDFHTTFGIISKDDMNSKGIIKSSKGKRFVSVNPNFSDLWEKLTRGPQLMIMAKCGVSRESVIVDAGGGTGSLCLSLANVCKKVHVYEINPEHFDVIAKNVKLFGVDNIDLKQANVYNGIVEKNVDIITLDLPEPWKVIESACGALKRGGHLVVYLPNLTQAKIFIDACHGSKIQVIETLELIERKWKIEERIMRPEFDMLGHTGFLIFCRLF